MSVPPGRTKRARSCEPASAATAMTASNAGAAAGSEATTDTS